MYKKLRIFRWVFGVLGIAMLVAAVALFVSTKSFIARAKRAPGSVVSLVEVRDNDGTTMWKPVISFEVDGQPVTFTSNTSSRPPAYHIAEEVQVLYAPRNPQDARIDGFWSLWVGPIVLGILGTVFGGIAAGMVLAHRNTLKWRDWLMANGTPVEAKLKSVEKDTTLKVNGSSPWLIVSQWQDPATRLVHVFKSESLWFDPSEYMTGRTTVPVLIDAANPKRYYVDVDFLPKLAE